MLVACRPGYCAHHDLTRIIARPEMTVRWAISGSIGGRGVTQALRPAGSGASRMKVVCAWCERDGVPAFMGEREPLDDPSITHGICPRHLTLMLSTLPSGSFPGVDLLVIVRVSDRALFEHLLWATSGVPDIRAIMERRRGERRRRIEGSVSERRERERRLILGQVSAMGYTMVRLRRSIGQSSASPPES